MNAFDDEFPVDGRTQMTFDEREAWELVRDAATACLRLPEQHPMERDEVCHAFHQIQNYLMARPGMRGMHAESAAVRDE